MRRINARSVSVVAWATLVVGIIAAPLLAPGVLALRDMLVLDSPALTSQAVGFGDLPARSAPQDGLLAVIGAVFPASWFARGLIIAAAAAGASGALVLTRHVRPEPSTCASLTAITIGVLNPMAIERLLQGQWSLAVAGWLLPVIAASGLSGRTTITWWAMLPASLTPTGGLLAAITAVATARGHRFATGLVGTVLSLPWVIPGALAAVSGTPGTSSAAAVAAFAPNGTHPLGAGADILNLSGMWNQAALPTTVIPPALTALAGSALFVLLLTSVRRVPASLLVLAAVGLSAALLAWAAPGVVSAVVETLPGGGLFRDAQKFVALALPAYVAAAGSLRPTPAVAALLLACVSVSFAPWALRALAPVNAAKFPSAAVIAKASAAAGSGDVLVTGDAHVTGSVTVIDGQAVVNPWFKALAAVEPGRLVVDGVEVDAPNPRWEAAMTAWSDDDTDALAELGVGAAIDGDTGRVLKVIPHTKNPVSVEKTAGVLLLVLWLATVPLATLTNFIHGRRPGNRQALPKPS